jgi:hypothetical protein
MDASIERSRRCAAINASIERTRASGSGVLSTLCGDVAALAERGEW